MKYNLPKEYYELFWIFSHDFPDFLHEFLEAKSLQRLAHIGQNCGTEYTNFFDYKFEANRLWHSIWVALIIWNFTHDRKQTLAGLFHDISNSVFSHVWDYVLWDTETQEAAEFYITDILQNDEKIMELLEKYHISIEEINDYTKYPIADNKSPKLSSDRLEYTLDGGIYLWYKNFQEVKKMYDDIVILKNENGEQELGFQTTKIAIEFAKLSVLNDSSCFSSFKSHISMSFLAEILKAMMREKILDFPQLYMITEEEFIKKIYTSKNEWIIKMWEFFIKMDTYKLSDDEPQTPQYFVYSKTKKRYIDPLVQTIDGVRRVSQIDSDFKSKVEVHLGSQEKWIEVDYERSDM